MRDEAVLGGFDLLVAAEVGHHIVRRDDVSLLHPELGAVVLHLEEERLADERLVRTRAVVLTEAQLRRMARLLGAEHLPVRRVAIRRRRPLVRTVVAIERQIGTGRAQREARDRFVHEEAMLLARLGRGDP